MPSPKHAPHSLGGAAPSSGTASYVYGRPLSGSYDRHRDVLPLPLGALSALDPQHTKLSRSVARRLQRCNRVEALALGVGTTLNEMFCGCSDEGDSSHPPTAAQSESASRLWASAKAFGPPPPGLSGPGALEALRVTQSYSGESATIAPLRSDNVESVSLPGKKHPPVDMLGISRDTGQKLIQRLKALELSQEQGRASIEASGPTKLYVDPALRNPRLYARLLRRLHDIGLVEYHATCICSVGVFFVYKKNGYLRLILDGRHASQFLERHPR